MISGQRAFSGGTTRLPLALRALVGRSGTLPGDLAASTSQGGPTVGALGHVRDFGSIPEDRRKACVGSRCERRTGESSPFSTISPTKTLAKPRTTVRIDGETDCCRTAFTSCAGGGGRLSFFFLFVAWHSERATHLSYATLGETGTAVRFVAVHLVLVKVLEEDAQVFLLASRFRLVVAKLWGLWLALGMVDRSHGRVGERTSSSENSKTSSSASWSSCSATAKEGPPSCPSAGG